MEPTPPTSVPDRLWTIDDAAEYLSVSRRKVERMRNSGDFPPAIRLGSLVRFNPATIVAFAERFTEAA